MRSAEIRGVAPGMMNAFCPLPSVATGGQPRAADLEALAAAGYRAILDIRAPGEPRGYDERAVAARAGMAYVNLPVGHGPLTDATFDEFRRILRDPANRPLLVHCASGNRVGLMLIPYLVLDEGKSPREALDLATSIGLSSAQLARIAMDYVARQGASRSDVGQVA